MSSGKGSGKSGSSGKKAVGGGTLNAKGFRKAPISKKQLLKNDSNLIRGTRPNSK